MSSCQPTLCLLFCCIEFLKLILPQQVVLVASAMVDARSAGALFAACLAPSLPTPQHKGAAAAWCWGPDCCGARGTTAAGGQRPLRPMLAPGPFSGMDSLPEWSKGVDSSSTSASCVGSNPTAVSAMLPLLPAGPMPARAACFDLLAPLPKSPQNGGGVVVSFLGMRLKAADRFFLAGSLVWGLGPPNPFLGLHFGGPARNACRARPRRAVLLGQPGLCPPPRPPGLGLLALSPAPFLGAPGTHCWAPGDFWTEVRRWGSNPRAGAASFSSHNCAAVDPSLTSQVLGNRGQNHPLPPANSQKLGAARLLCPILSWRAGHLATLAASWPQAGRQLAASWPQAGCRLLAGCPQRAASWLPACCFAAGWLPYLSCCGLAAWLLPHCLAGGWLSCCLACCWLLPGSLAAACLAVAGCLAFGFLPAGWLPGCLAAGWPLPALMLAVAADWLAARCLSG